MESAISIGLVATTISFAKRVVDLRGLVGGFAKSQDESDKMNVRVLEATGGG